jgi:hypothetical protein
MTLDLQYRTQRERPATCVGIYEIENTNEIAAKENYIATNTCISNNSYDAHTAIAAEGPISKLSDILRNVSGTGNLTAS